MQLFGRAPSLDSTCSQVFTTRVVNPLLCLIVDVVIFSCHVTLSGADFMSVIGFPLDHSLTAQGPILGRRTQKRGLGGGGEAHCGECFYGFVHYLWFDIVRCIMRRGDTQDGG